MRWGPLLFLSLWIITGCPGTDDGVYDTDLDGTVDRDDCAPADPAISPDAPEAADGIDNDCDGWIDEDTAGYDDDADGWCEGFDYGDGEPSCIDGALPGDCDDTNPALEPADSDGDGQSTCEGDCDDQAAARLTGAAEVCDGLDNDCDGELALSEQDLDGDGASPCAGDCDDTDPLLNPIDDDGDGFSLCDGDCDDSDDSLSPTDADGDGWSLCLGDCDDLNPDISPGQTEACDLVFDSSCDPADDPTGDGIDEDGDGDPACSDCDDADPSASYLDVDGDGFASCGEVSDCNDLVAGIAPGASDLFGDEIDSNCDGTDGVDSDDDGFAGEDSGGPDCDDADPAVHPGDDDGDGSSLCDGDCDDSDASLEALDVDGDGSTTCDGDCDDGDPTRAPSLTETCDLVADSDCDPSNDVTGDGVDDDGDGDPACTDCADDDPIQNTLDSDGDGYSSCDGDCNDVVITTHPAAMDEWGDSIDTNCDLLDGVDSDGDGWPGNESATFKDCDDTDPEANLDDADGDGSTTCDGDCDDDDPAIEVLDADGDGFTTCGVEVDPLLPRTDVDCDDSQATVHPDAVEICDLFDTDCDPATTLPDDGVDADGDLHPPCAECDDTNPDTWPGAPEICDGEDNDCDGALMVHGPDGEIDNDSDGFADCEGDCDDFDDTVYPGALELCDGQDTDCNGIVDDVFDNDGDGWCNDPLIDCDDNDPTIHPGQWEVPFDDFDADCDGTDFIGIDQGHVLINGSTDQREAGTGLAGGGDVDGDPFPDLLVSEVGASPWYYNGVCLFAGVDLQSGGTVSMGAAHACIADGGAEVAFLPDFDGDGLDEVVSLSGHSSGRTQVYTSTTLAPGGVFPLDPWAGDVWIEGAPFTSLAVGDLDGDGLGDLALGAPAWGYTYVYSGTTLAAGGILDLADADMVFAGTGGSGNTGYALAIGNFDGDGWDDLAIGSPDWGDTTAGSVHVFYGYPLAWGSTYTMADAHVSLWGESIGERAGWVLSAIGDLDDDGVEELAITAYRWSSDRGRIYVVQGSTLSTLGDHQLASAWARIEGPEPYTYLGKDLAGPGDLDGDGTPDLLVGVQGHEHWVIGGFVDVYSGTALAAGGVFGRSDATWVFNHEPGYNSVGYAVAGAGDMDLDGAPDLLLSAPTWDIYNSGQASLLLNPL